MRATQRTTFFGYERACSMAVLTPIVAIYDALPEGEPLSGGWWPSKVVLDDVLVVATPQASAILDAVCALEPITPIIFLGLAGALSTYTVGDIVEPSTAVLDDAAYLAGRDPTSLYRDARVATVRCLNESTQRQDELRGRADVVDMESAWVCAVAQRHGVRARVVLLVSDEIGGRTFIDARLDDLGPSIARLAAGVYQQIAKGEC
jgi:Phosphorylase superfamily